jgi:hypothetical protein
LGRDTWAGRAPFAFCGLLTAVVVFGLIRRRFQDTAWAVWAALLLCASVPFLLYARQCRYYALAALLVAVSLAAFFSPWQKRFGPAAALVLSLSLLFYANYLLFFTYVPAMVLGAVLVYRDRLPVRRTLIMGAATVILALPGFALSEVGQQSGLMDLHTVLASLKYHFINHFLFMIPLPVAVGLAWRLRPFLGFQRIGPIAPAERLMFFLTAVILINILLMGLIPQYFFRYLVHLYPLCAIVLGWAVVKLTRWHGASGALLALLLVLTNWLHVLPLDILGLTPRPWHTDYRMLNNANPPWKLMGVKWAADFPDVNEAVIDYLQQNAAPGQIVLATYGDLPLMFYTDLTVYGGLQDRTPPAGAAPDYVVMRPFITLARSGARLKSDQYVQGLPLERAYREVVLPGPMEAFGDRPDPYFQRFYPPKPPYSRMRVYRLREGAP